MRLSDLAMYRPVLAIVVSALLVVFGLVSLSLLPVREMPDIDNPVISVGTAYRGAASNIVESQITNPIEDQLSGIDGIDYIWSSSWDGWSGVTITFKQGHDMLEALSDVRDAVNRARNELPDDVDEPVIRKDDGDNAPIMWLNLVGSQLDRVDMSDFAERVLVERLSLLPGVSAVNTSGVVERVMYIEIDPTQLAARGLTTQDIIEVLAQENIQLPAGYIRNETLNRVVRVDRQYQSQQDFESIQLTSGVDGPVYLRDVANIYVGAKKDTTTFRANGVDSYGIGIVPMSQANPLEVADEVRRQLPHLQQFLPDGAELYIDYDSTKFIRAAINEVYFTLAYVAIFVLLVLYVFLGRVGSTLIPAITVPISLIASLTVAYLAGFSINLVTLMAMVLAIGLVVDDAVVVTENIARHRANGESPLVAAFKGARELNFAVIATTVVLVMVFLPLLFMDGQMGRLFTEFAVLLSAAIVVSSLVALTLAPVMGGALFKDDGSCQSGFQVAINSGLEKLRLAYIGLLGKLLKHSWLALSLVMIALVALVLSFQAQKKAFAPKEDRGTVNVYVGGVEATSYERMLKSMSAIEKRLIPLRDDGPIRSLNYSSPAFGSWADHQGFFIIQLEDWADREESAYDVVEMIRAATIDVPDVKVIPYVPGFGGSMGEPVQFVVQGEDYQQLWHYARELADKASASGFMEGVDLDYNPTTPELILTVDLPAARQLGVSVQAIASTLEVLLGGRNQTRFEERGDEYDVYLKADESQFMSETDLAKVYVPSESGELISLNTVVMAKEQASARGLFHYQRKKSINIKANLTADATLGEALDFFAVEAQQLLPSGYTFDYAGESKEYFDSQRDVTLLFGLALLVCYLVLAAQFESFISPSIVMITVPLGLLGGLVGLLMAGETFNIYSQLGLLMLIGMVTKNGILIVEFANQLRDQGKSIADATLTAAGYRLRPILMTACTTLLGALPMLLASGAGAENRFAIGVVIVGGMLLSTVITLVVIPSLYNLLAGFSRSPQARQQALDGALNDKPHRD
ncbi:efflux RND transporter permease subunit [Neiella sp. HB171785]|uniref:Efflux RND transporter permease subunit n=1 Tax=Neiella litorisoli TaxID=2771431 RepID=A0A8J6QGP8_9GAMM|nr:efflux RND transporter permease subunit [Neiella litorisoli]MBD1389105.1 efflux RND transporter permease subunit [Neiella litorisoli]